ncbi:hypothetical protein [Anaerosolibacter sp.]|uniref:hypothetical protein n=1 Tax=Anaerosolibacter sp. TaxID=1872527 RepID=UPI0039F0E457
MEKYRDRRLSKSQRLNEYNLKSGDEYYQNGIFVFNITRLTEYIKNNKEEFEIIEVKVKDYQSMDKGKSLNQEYVATADLTRPLILAEIVPDRLKHGYPDISLDYYSRGFNVIDGHHRLAKAYQEGIETLSAYVVRMEQHIPFMVKGYDKYVEYWNSKLV